MPSARLIGIAGVALVVVIGLVIAAVQLTGATPAPIEVRGDIIVHDPALVAGQGGQAWYVYSTGGSGGDGNVQIRTSEDGELWTFVGEVWDEKPEWLVDAVPGVDNLWAPELFENEGTWYLYYAASTFGSNHSVIALATNSTLDPEDPAYEWVDQGLVLASFESDDYNAIDAGIVEDDNGTPWMSFGSFWSGIRMVELEWPSGLRADDAEPLRLADRGSPPDAIEAPYIVPHGGRYYLFVSRDSCCRGLGSTYNMAVGVSDEVTGPYVDRDGVPLLENGGTLLLQTSGAEIGPGGQSVSGGYLAYHFYNGDSAGAPTLAIRPLHWASDGWPELAPAP